MRSTGLQLSRSFNLAHDKPASMGWCQRKTVQNGDRNFERLENLPWGGGRTMQRNLSPLSMGFTNGLISSNRIQSRTFPLSPLNKIILEPR